MRRSILPRLIGWTIGIAIIVFLAWPFGVDVVTRYQLNQDLRAFSHVTSRDALVDRFGSAQAAADSVAQRCHRVYGDYSAECQSVAAQLKNLAAR